VANTKRSYAEMLSDLGQRVPEVVVFDIGLATSMQTDLFKTNFPHRYFNLGIAEQNAVGLAAGMAKRGFVPLVHSFSNFLARRAHDQIALSIAWPGCNVKLIGGSCGLFDGRNGPSHMAIDDLSVMAALPGVTVVEPGDMAQTESLLNWIVERAGPAYLRLRRHGAHPDLIPERDSRQGVNRVGADQDALFTLVACGSMLEETLAARDLLHDAELPHDLIHVSVLRPIDYEPILESGRNTGLVVTVENHVPSGGFGDAIGRALGPHGVCHCRLSLPDEFIPAGDPNWQMQYCRLDRRSISERIAVLVSGEKHVPLRHTVSRH
jgi:transketolase